MNLVEKFGEDDFLERTWELPPALTPPLRDLVDVSDDGWIMDEWAVTDEIAAIVQPYLDEPIDVESGRWCVSSEQRP
ncbi:MAG: hypothetical protein ACRDT8_20910 [Micromonosporaceae bacterium]